MDCTWFLPPNLVEFLSGKIQAHAAGIAGALFGAGWCFWIDALLINEQAGSRIPFVEYVPGIVATLAMLLMCVVRDRGDNGYDVYDTGSYCRQRFWLFVAYILSFGSVAGSVVLLFEHSGGGASASGRSTALETWTGWASVMQVVFILGSGLILFASRRDGDFSYDGGYTAF